MRKIFISPPSIMPDEYGQDEDRARRVAWSAVKKAGYEKGESGKWQKTG